MFSVLRGFVAGRLDAGLSETQPTHDSYMTLTALKIKEGMTTSDNVCELSNRA